MNFILTIELVLDQMCKEVAEGLRILIDFNLRRVLLYRNAGELEQYDEVSRFRTFFQRH
jgi:hypothetical protein